MINSFDTVEDFFKKIKSNISTSFAYVAVKGEISRISYPNSGHIYFTLKDEKSSISCMCLKTNIKYLSNKISENKQMIIVGKVSAFERNSQLYILVHDTLGIEDGKLHKNLEQQKQELEKQGYFANSAKQSIPSLAKTIGVITSSQGAVKHDIINRINARRPCKIVFYHSTMQGELAISEVIKGIKTLNNLKNNKPELIIIARGGGSLEDLEVFNSEKIVKAVYESKLPIISAIGHETDYTFVDFTADLRASTPTAAAEIVTQITTDDLINKVQIAQYKINNTYKNKIQNYKKSLTNAVATLNKEATNKINIKFVKLNYLQKGIVSPINYIKHSKYKLDKLQQSINNFVQNAIYKKQSKVKNALSSINVQATSIVKEKQNKIALTQALLEKYNNKELLKKGFAVFLTESGTVVKNTKELKAGKSYKVTMQDGSKNITLC